MSWTKIRKNDDAPKHMSASSADAWAVGWNDAVRTWRHETAKSRYTQDDWKAEVASDETTMGYDDWLKEKVRLQAERES